MLQMIYRFGITACEFVGLFPNGCPMSHLIVIEVASFAMQWLKRQYHGKLHPWNSMFTETVKHSLGQYFDPDG